jgi:hypothetical protein
LFASSISFASFGDIMNNVVASSHNKVAEGTAGSASLVLFYVRYCIGFSLGDYQLIRADRNFSPKDDCCSKMLLYPELLGIGAQILSLWAETLDIGAVHEFMDIFQRISSLYVKLFVYYGCLHDWNSVFNSADNLCVDSAPETLIVWHRLTSWKYY